MSKNNHVSTPCQNNVRGDLLTSVLLANVRQSDVTRMQPRISYTQVAVAETMCVSLGNFAIFALVASSLAMAQHSTPLPERGVKFCLIPCREVRVNASEIREVFVSHCALAKVVIVGDPRTVTVRDSAGPCGKFKYFY